MNTLSIALRNLVRNSRRSVATLLGVGIGTVALLLFGGYKANINDAMQTAFVRLGGHLEIQHRDYFLHGSGNPTAYGISNAGAIIDAINRDPELQRMTVVVTPTLKFGAIAGNYAAGVSRTVIGNGIVIDDQAKLRQWNPYGLDLDTPPFALEGSAPDSAMVGLSLARVLQLCQPLGIADCPQPLSATAPAGKSLPSDIAALSALESKSTSGKAGRADPSRRIELLASSSRGVPNVATLTVVHAESQGFKELDEVYVVLHLRQAQRLVYGSSAPKVTSIIIQLKDTRLTAAAQARIESHLEQWSDGQQLSIRDFRLLNPFYVQSIDMFDTIFGFMFILIGGITMFTVSNTMNTTVTERTVEIGTLRAIGVRQAGIRRMFITEGALLGSAGAGLGILIALGAATIVNALHLRWLPPGSATSVPLALSVWGQPLMIIGTTLGLIAMATAAAWWPAYRAARLNVVEALRHA
jgi:putative ABC transport system permease protein